MLLLSHIVFVYVFNVSCKSNNHKLHLGKAYCWPLIREQCSINLVINVARCLMQLFSPTTLAHCPTVQLSSLSTLVLPIICHNTTVVCISAFLLEVMFYSTKLLNCIIFNKNTANHSCNYNLRNTKYYYCI